MNSGLFLSRRRGGVRRVKMVSGNLFHYRKNSWPPEEYINRTTLQLVSFSCYLIPLLCKLIIYFVNECIFVIGVWWYYDQWHYHAWQLANWWMIWLEQSTDNMGFESLITVLIFLVEEIWEYREAFDMYSERCKLNAIISWFSLFVFMVRGA